MREKSVILKNNIGAALIGRNVVDHFSTDADFTAIGVLQASDQSQRGGLPAPTGPQKREKLPFSDNQTQIVHSNHATVSLYDVC
jgi:hypothetical protein